MLALKCERVKNLCNRFLTLEHERRAIEAGSGLRFEASALALFEGILISRADFAKNILQNLRYEGCFEKILARRFEMLFKKASVSMSRIKIFSAK